MATLATVTASDWMPAQHDEVRVVLAGGEADMAAGAAFKDQHGADDRLGVPPEQQPISCPTKINTKYAEQQLFKQTHTNTNLDEISAPRCFGWPQGNRPPPFTIVFAQLA